MSTLLGYLCFIAGFAAGFFVPDISFDVIAICLCLLGTALIIEAAIQKAARAARE